MNEVFQNMKEVFILYYSQKGHTKDLAKRILEIFTSFAPKDVKIQMMDAKEIKMDALKQAAGFIIGSPDFFSYPAGWIKNFFDDIWEDRDHYKNRPAFGFITHGGTGKAIKPLEDLIKSCQFKVIQPFISVGKEINQKIEAQIQKNCQIMLDLLK